MRRLVPHPPRRRHGLLGASPACWPSRSRRGSACGFRPRRLDGDVSRSGALNLHHGGDRVAPAARQRRDPRPVAASDAIWSSGASWSARSRCSCIRSATAASPASSRSTPSRSASPRALYFTVFCLTIIVTRPFIGRYADRVGYAACSCRASSLIVARRRRCWRSPTAAADFVASALLFGIGFGSAYPIFVAHLMHHVAEHRRGATFGASSARSTPASAPARSRWAGSSSTTASAAPSASPARWRCSRFRIFSTWRSGNGLRPSRHDRPEGLAAVPRHDDLGTPAWRPWVLDEAPAGRSSSARWSTASTSSTPPTCTRVA